MPYEPLEDTPDMPDLAEFISTEEAAQQLGYNIQTVRRLVREGKLQAIKVNGTTWLVFRKAIQDYQQAHSGQSKHNPRQ